MSTADGIEPFEGDDRQYTPTRLPEVNGPARIQPPQFTRAQLADLSRRDLLVHDDNREVWHAKSASELQLKGLSPILMAWFFVVPGVTGWAER
ncbi:hypothetical protein ABTZ58_38950 [Streptomyces sp. NPDC094143]|uniref:hypothetical protein n=1 Tax=Streptomyces sp. NPDC094143 TaxID=3155310 RepID=UPI00332DB2EB